MDDTDLPGWQDAAALGTVEEIVGWAHHDFHLDFTNHDLVLTLASDALSNGVWRNNSEIEDIHAGLHKRVGQAEPRGLSDAEMMVGSIETTKMVRQRLRDAGPHWWSELAGDLCDYHRPLAGTPLSEHVPRRVLSSNTKMVRRNLILAHHVSDLIGWDRFLLGTALCGLAYTHWGTPWWVVQVSRWAGALPQPARPEVVAQLKDDPTALHLGIIEEALATGLGMADGRAVWHERYCGNAEHLPSVEVQQFLGLMHGLTGMPQMWMYATARQHAVEHGSRTRSRVPH